MKKCSKKRQYEQLGRPDHDENPFHAMQVSGFQGSSSLELNQENGGPDLLHLRRRVRHRASHLESYIREHLLNDVLEDLCREVAVLYVDHDASTVAEHYLERFSGVDSAWDGMFFGQKDASVSLSESNCLVQSLMMAMNNDEERRVFNADNLMKNFLTSLKNSAGEAMYTDTFQEGVVPSTVVLYLKKLREEGLIRNYTYRNVSRDDRSFDLGRMMVPQDAEELNKAYIIGGFDRADDAWTFRMRDLVKVALDACTVETGWQPPVPGPDAVVRKGQKAKLGLERGVSGHLGDYLTCKQLQVFWRRLGQSYRMKDVSMTLAAWDKLDASMEEKRAMLYLNDEITNTNNKSVRMVKTGKSVNEFTWKGFQHAVCIRYGKKDGKWCIVLCDPGLKKNHYFQPSDIEALLEKLLESVGTYWSIHEVGIQLNDD
eukprot:gene35390-42895_t